MFRPVMFLGLVPHSERSCVDRPFHCKENNILSAGRSFNFVLHQQQEKKSSTQDRMEDDDDVDGYDGDDGDKGVFDSSPSVKLWGKLSENLGKMCCVRPHIDRFTFVGKTRNKTRGDHVTTLCCGAVLSSLCPCQMKMPTWARR